MVVGRKTARELDASDREKYDNGDLVITDLEECYKEHINEVCNAGVSLNGNVHESVIEFKQSDPNGYKTGLQKYGKSLFYELE